MSPRTMVFVTLTAAAAMVSAPALAKDKFKADLDGFQETPAVSSTGSGEFRAQVSKDKTMLDFEFTYSGLEGGTSLFAHIHFGQPGVAGGVAAFLCGGSTKPTPCPDIEGTVTGSITAADVVGPNGQGIEPGSFSELLRAMDDGVTYVNIHTTRWPGGEIRGAVK